MRRPRETVEYLWPKINDIWSATNTDEFLLYDAASRLVRKQVSGSTISSENKTTYYVYDAGGTLIAVYENTGLASAPALVPRTLVEHPIYGNGRVGVSLPPSAGITRTTPAVSSTETLFTRYVDRKLYELTDHLGNVRVVIGDVKLDKSGSAPYFTADLKNYTNYYPFGMMQPYRNWNSSGYRYGFNGYESNSEINGLKNIYSTYFRMYDPRLGRWWSNDPVLHPWESPYAGFAPTW